MPVVPVMPIMPVAPRVPADDAGRVAVCGKIFWPP
jgi:hypothetical protein